MLLNVNGREYQIKYGVEATAKSKLLSKVVSVETTEMTLESIEQIALTIGEVLLVGLQNYHSDEFGYDLNSNEGKDEMLSKACKLIDDYTDIDGNDILSLYADLQSEMMKNGFIKSLFEKMKDAEQTMKKTSRKKTTN